MMRKDGKEEGQKVRRSEGRRVFSSSTLTLSPSHALTFCLVCLLAAGVAGAATVYVSPLGDGTKDGATEGNPMAWATYVAGEPSGDTVYLVDPNAAIFYEYENGGTAESPVAYVQWPDCAYYSKIMIEYGITVYFNNTYTRIGRFINGDYWVVGSEGTVTISAYTPAWDVFGKSIASFAEYDATRVQVNCSAAHGYQDNQILTIIETTNYNGTYTIDYVDSDSFLIVHSWDGDDATGTVGYIVNGMQIDPSDAVTKQGIDQRDKDNWLGSLNRSMDLPLELPEAGHDYPCTVLVATSVPEGGHHTGTYTHVDTIVILTILETPIANNVWFAPSYWDHPGRAVEHQWSDVLTDYIQSVSMACTWRLPQYTGDGPYSSIERSMARRHPEVTGGWWNEYVAPYYQMRDYGREWNADVGQAYLALHSNQWSLAQKKRLLIGCIQMGIDLSGPFLDGQKYFWGEAGTHRNGRFWPILFAGIMLNDADLIAVGDHADDDTCNEEGYICFSNLDQTLGMPASWFDAYEISATPYVCDWRDGQDTTGTVQVTNGSTHVVANDGDTWPNVVAGKKFMTTVETGVWPRTCLDEVRSLTPAKHAYAIASVDKTSSPYTLELTENYDGTTNKTAYFVIATNIYTGTQYRKENGGYDEDYDEFDRSWVGAYWWFEQGHIRIYGQTGPHYKDRDYQDSSTATMPAPALCAVLMDGDTDAVALWNSPSYFYYVNRMVEEGHGGGPATWTRAVIEANWDLTGILTLPPEPSTPSPADEATGVSLTPTLTWSMPETMEAVHVYFGTSAVLSDSDDKGLETDGSYSPGELEADTNYYWQLGYWGGRGDVYSFTTGDAFGVDPATNLSPDEATVRPGSVVLSWTAGQGAVSHYLYLATVLPLTESDLVGEALETTSCSVSVPAGSTTYYWSVVEHGTQGTSTAAEASFTTAPRYVGVKK
jgi:hypothetical protein